MARVKIPSMKDLVARNKYLDMGGVNARAHDQLHGPKILIYTSTLTLNTTAGSKLVMPRGGQVTGVSCKLGTTPVTTAFKVDVLIDAISVFDGTYLQVAAGDTVSRPKIIERPYFNEDSVFTVQVNTVSSAGGPMVMTIEYLEEF